MRKKSGIVAICLSLFMVFTKMPTNTLQAYADTSGGTATGLLENGVLDGLKVRIRPAGSFKPLSINEDGEGNQNCVHLYYQGLSSQFYLGKADNSSYYINYFKHYYDETPKTTGDCRLDLEDDGGYDKEGQVIHVVSGNATAENKRWQFIRQDDGTYYIRNKRTQKYWALQDIDKDPSKAFKNNTKLVQSSKPLKWDIEIVSKNNYQFSSMVQFDSRNFQYKGKTVSSNNWMSALSDDLRVSDISIPGTHDVGTCRLHKDQDSMSTQRYYIDEMLNAGVRHMDLRTGLDGETVRIVHSDAHALNHEGSNLTLEETMNWIIAFLEKNPKETIVLQPKMDKEGGKCDYLTYLKLREYAVGKGKYIWSGDHVPTLGEARGKILVLSRLNTENDFNNFNYDMPQSSDKWALDLDHWNNSGGAESEDRAAAHTAFGVNFDVWVQDNYKHTGDEKKDYIKKTLYGNKNDGYTNGTQYHYDQSKMNGKHAWVLNYTSASHKSVPYLTPFDLSKEIQQWMLDRSDDYNRLTERIISKDTFTGILAFDYMDGLLSTFIYKTNFKRDYITVNGVDVAGQKAAAPLVLQIGESEQPNKLLSETTKKILEGQFNMNGYELIPANDGDHLTENKVTSQEELNSGTTQFRRAIAEGNVPENTYVHLQTSITDIDLDVDMPKCGTTVSASDPQVSVDVGSSTGFDVRSAFISQSADTYEAFEGEVEGGSTVPVWIKIVPKWGYRFDGECTVRSDTADIQSSVVTGGEISVNLQAAIPHDTEQKSAQAAKCTSNGTKEHYVCKNCHKYLLEKKAGEEDVLVEADEDEIITEQALGHQWDHAWADQWDVSKQPTEEEEGEEYRTCTRCQERETRKIPATGHITHSLTHVEAVEASCSAEGNVAYYECSKCGRCFADEEASQELTPQEIVIPMTEHNWKDPEYTTSRVGDIYYMTASMECSNNPSHVKSETVPALTEVDPATCEDNGSITLNGIFVNQAFGSKEIVMTVYALGHDWSAWNVEKEANCSEKGRKTRTCSRCDATETEEIPIDKDAHDTYNEFDESTNTATCEETGRASQYEVCSICDKVISQKRLTTAAQGHDWVETVYKWSADMSEATATRKCARRGCEKEESETVKTTSRVMEKGTCDTEGMMKYDAQFTNEAFDTQEKAVKTKPTGHNWGEWKVNKEATTTEAGEKQRVCKNDPSHIEKEVIPAKGYEPGTDPNQKGTDGTAVGPGASALSADKAITGMTSDKDPKGSAYNKLRLRSSKQTKKSITLKWGKPSKSATFVLYGNKCGAKNKMKKIMTYTGSSKKLTKVAGKKLKKGTYYKFILVALDQNNNVISTSKVIHVATGGGKVTNPKKIKVKKGKKSITKLTVKKGKTVKVKTTVTKESKKLKLKKHRKVVYESTNTKIATVTGKGKVKGIKKGKCYIYAYAQNGIARKVTVTVK